MLMSTEQVKNIKKNDDKLLMMALSPSGSRVSDHCNPIHLVTLFATSVYVSLVPGIISTYELDKVRRLAAVLGWRDGAGVVSGGVGRLLDLIRRS